MYPELTDEHKAIIAYYVGEVIEGRMRMKAALLLANLDMIETIAVPPVFHEFLVNWIQKVKQS